MAVNIHQRLPGMGILDEILRARHDQPRMCCQLRGARPGERVLQKAEGHAQVRGRQCKFGCSSDIHIDHTGVVTSECGHPVGETPQIHPKLLLGGVIYPLHMPSASSADGDGKRRALLFKELFFKNCQLDASVYMCAPPELIKKHVWAIGIKAGVIVTDGDVQAPADDGDTGEQNTAGGSTDTMGPIVDRNLPGEITGAATNVATLSDSIFLHTAYQSRLAQYMKLLPADSANRPNVAMVNLEQNVYRSSSAVSKMAPTLLRGSILHELATDKMVVPLQHWLIMGWPVPGLVPNRFSGFFPFPDLLESLTPCQSRTLTGNGMHVAAIGLWTLYGLATTGKEYRDVE